jgi:uncharacterized coiled-coil protein SlyX
MENRVIQRVRVASAIFSTRKELRMAVPWLAVGNLVLGNLDKIIGVVRPGFTRKQIETLDSQTDLLNQQIAELQAASAANAEQVRELASQLKDVVAALEQAGSDAARDRAATRRVAYIALALGAAGLALGAAALLI